MTPPVPARLVSLLHPIIVQSDSGQGAPEPNAFLSFAAAVIGLALIAFTWWRWRRRT